MYYVLVYSTGALSRCRIALFLVSCLPHLQAFSAMLYGSVNTCIPLLSWNHFQAFLVMFPRLFSSVFCCVPVADIMHLWTYTGDGLQVFSGPFVVLCYTMPKKDSQFPETFQKCTKKRVVMHILTAVNFL